MNLNVLAILRWRVVRWIKKQLLAVSSRSIYLFSFGKFHLCFWQLSNVKNTVCTFIKKVLRVNFWLCGGQSVTDSAPLCAFECNSAYRSLSSQVLCLKSGLITVLDSVDQLKDKKHLMSKDLHILNTIRLESKNFLFHKLCNCNFVEITVFLSLLNYGEFFSAREMKCIYNLWIYIISTANLQYISSMPSTTHDINKSWISIYWVQTLA